MLRSIIERISRDKVFRRRLPNKFGNRPLYVSPDSALSYLKRDWGHGKHELLNAVLKYVKPSDNVWDIGGNVGVFSFAAAHIAGSDAEIVTLEPDPFLATLLQRTALHATNVDLQVNVVCGAVSDNVGLGRFIIAKRGRSSNSLERSGHRSQAGGTRYVQHVPTITLDSLLDHFSPPRVIKIDIEGGEAFALRGAERIMSECRPIFYIEVGAEQNADVTTEFQRHGYRLYDGDAEDGIERQACNYNTLAVPSESDRTNRG